MNLQYEIDEHRQQIRNDSYSMSIGEWINLYSENDIIINPHFQRLYRWNNSQKSRLIESILLGIPIPPIFVSEKESGIWELVDGLQRLSTILEFVGILKDENNNTIPPLVLEKQKYLTQLEGKVWKTEVERDSLTPTQRTTIKRSRLDVIIIQKESSKLTKYELFDRLNTGGTKLSDQEVRNSFVSMTNLEFHNWIIKNANYKPFLDCLSLSNRQIKEQFHVELFTRYIIFKQYKDFHNISLGSSLAPYLNDKIISFAENPPFDLKEEEKIFVKIIDSLNQKLDEKSFKRYDLESKDFKGPFVVSVFEIILFGLGHNYQLIEKIDIKNRIIEAWTKGIISSEDYAATPANSRIPKLLKKGMEIFSYED